MARADATTALLGARDFLLAHRTDYAAAKAGFRWPAPEQFNFALDWFDVIARERDREALRIVGPAPTVSRTYADLACASNRVANSLRVAGLRRGDTALLMLGNVEPLWVAMLAMMKLGAVMIPATTLLSADDLRDRLGRGGVKLVVAGAEHVPLFEAVGYRGARMSVGGRAQGWLAFEDSADASERFDPQGETRAYDPMLLYFTSGTTAQPKLVLHSHLSYPVGHLSTLYWLGLKPDDVHLNISSPGWAKHAWSCVFAPWLAEATVLVLNHPRFDAVTTLDALVEQGVTSFCAPPTVWRMLIQQDLKTWKTRLRETVGAGEPLNPEVIDQVRAAWGLTVRDGYGQTETTAQIGNTPGQAVVAGAMGRALPGYRILLLDPDGEEAEEGEISLALGEDRPAGLMLGYRLDDAIIPCEGAAYRTGDVAMRGADGMFTYVGRADDVFKASDYRISPFELESVLIEHAAVAEAAVVPSPDPTRLAEPKAFIALAPGAAADAATAASILAHARAALGPYKRVRRIEFADLPKTISGKIRRVELRRLEAQRRAAGERGPLEWIEEDFKGWIGPGAVRPPVDPT
jgi:acetyl-CoA synthetase